MMTLPEAVAWRRSIPRLAFTNGVFDILHVGHIRTLEAARAEGDALLVAVNGDSGVRKLDKSGDRPRPINPGIQRARVVAACESVNAVILFDEPTADRLLEALRPEIVVKGGDYDPDTLPERDTIVSYGGSIQIVDYVKDQSTTSIVRRIVGQN
ncbi:MAG: adenylyltransferase/cytidyltransferase family protein [Gemmatimonadales bacterium]